MLKSDTDGYLWKIAYVAVLSIPLMLILSRGVADGMCVFTGVSFLIHSKLCRDWKWLSDPVVRVSFLAWLWMLVAVSPFAFDVRHSFEDAASWIRFMLLYAAIRHWVLVKRKPIEIWAYASLGLIALVMADSLWQYISGTSLSGYAVGPYYRLTGPFGTHEKVGIYLAKLFLPPIGAMFFLTISKKKLLPAIGVAAFLLACTATIMLSGERTAFCSSMLAIAIIAAIMAYSDKKWRLASVAMLVVMLGLAGVLLATQSSMQWRLQWLQTNLGDFSHSTYGQLIRTGFDMGEKHWESGVGFKGFRLLCPNYIEHGVVDFCSIHPHNAYIEWFAETGLPGLLCFLVLILAMFKSAIVKMRMEKGEKRLTCAFAIGVLALNFFPLMATQSFFSNWPAILLWYSLASGFAAINLNNTVETT